MSDGSDDGSKEFVPEVLGGYAKRVQGLRNEVLCDVDTEASEPNAEQYFLLALSALDQAERFFRLAQLNQTQALAHQKRF